MERFLIEKGRTGRLACPLFLIVCCSVYGQDLRKITSPDGKTEFRIFIAPQEDVPFFRLAYQVWSGGQPVVDTSFMGLNVYEQEPILGENIGLIGETGSHSSKYNSLLAHYMQNGSTGRSLDLDIRVYNGGVAFRYTIPKSNLLEHPDVDAELTEFHIAGVKLSAPVALPATLAAIEIAEVRGPNTPATLLRQFAKNTLITTEAYSGAAPLTGPWRVIAVGGNAREIVSDLPR